MRLAYLNITPRPWKGPHARQFASHLDYSFSRKMKPAMKNFRLPNLYCNKRKTMGAQWGYMDHIMTGLLDHDKNHLNDWGYHIVMHDVMSALSIRLYNPRYGSGLSKARKSPSARTVSLCWLLTGIRNAMGHMTLCRVNLWSLLLVYIDRLITPMTY